MSKTSRQIEQEAINQWEKKTLGEWRDFKQTWVPIERRAWAFLLTNFRDRNIKSMFRTVENGDGLERFVVGTRESLRFLAHDVKNAKIEHGQIEVVSRLLDQLQRAASDSEAHVCIEQVC